MDNTEEKEANLTELYFIDYLLQYNYIDSKTLSTIDPDEDKVQYLIKNKIFIKEEIDNHKASFELVNKININTLSIDPKVSLKLKEKIARKNKVILLSIENGVAHVAMENPSDIEKVANLSDTLLMPVTGYFCVIKDLSRIINMTYRAEKKIEHLFKVINNQFTSSSKKFISKIIKSATDNNEKNIIDIIQIIMEDAYNVDCSDVHLEYTKSSFRVRLRVDGTMQEQQLEGFSELSAPLFRVIKLMCGMDISITNVPQDGRLDMTIGNNRKLSSRVSICPNVDGASCVIRLFQEPEKIPPYTVIFNNSKLLNIVKTFSKKIQGMMLITGPTGSGKTTTLYSLLNHMNNSDKKIITVEDPVELIVPGLNQIEVKEGGGMEFSDAIKACLRQDPDIVLVGEIRDEETANIGMRAAITGHLVLSTLHTNGTIATISRVMNLDISNHLLADAIEVILSQRLIKKICSNCSQESKLPAKLNDPYLEKRIQEEKHQIRKGTGCAMCNFTGYRGRLPIIEYLNIDQNLKDHIDKGDFSSFKDYAFQQIKGRELLDLVTNCLLQGKTGYDEYLKFMTIG